MNAQTPAAAVKTILVVDDDQVILSSLTLMLQSAGYRTLTAVSGGEVPPIARKEKVDLILIDLVFPTDETNIGSPLHDGFFVIEWLRRAIEAANIPFIIISGTDPEKYKARALNMGVAGCLQKPLNKDKLLGMIQILLNQNPP